VGIITFWASWVTFTVVEVVWSVTS
jgi:hypothetical protein